MQKIVQKIANQGESVATMQKIAQKNANQGDPASTMQKIVQKNANLRRAGAASLHNAKNSTKNSSKN